MAGEWIPCTEKLPDPGTYVLVSYNGHVWIDHRDILEYIDYEDCFYESGIKIRLCKEKMAWMPLPDPYNPATRIKEGR